MLDLLYYYRRNNVDAAKVKDHIKNYYLFLKENTGFQLFDAQINTFNFETGTIDQLIDILRPEAIAAFESNRLYRNGVLTATGKTIGDISKIVLNTYMSAPSSHGGSNALYVMHYAKWIYCALEDIFSCIIYNGSISDIEYVGVRTKEYLKTLNLDEMPKRFGYPNNRLAAPLALSRGDFSLSSPPMTRLAHSREYIAKVYKFFGYTDFYEVNIGKTLFTRCVEDREVRRSHVPVDAFTRETELIKKSSDINASFLYDLFFCIYVQRLCHLEIEENDIFSAFGSQFGDVLTTDDKYLYKLRKLTDGISLGELITMVY